MINIENNKEPQNLKQVETNKNETTKVQYTVPLIASGN